MSETYSMLYQQRIAVSTAQRFEVRTYFVDIGPSAKW